MIFSPIHKKKVYMKLFSTAQRHYYAFSTFAHIFKNRQYEYYNNDVDICLNPLSSFPEVQKVTLLHYKKKYVFRLTDFMNIWLQALRTNNGFSPAPRYPFNPYINRPFRKHHLYIVYFKLLDTKFIIPPLIQKFYHLEFNIVDFELTSYPILKEYAIKNYIQSEDDSTLFLDIIHMVETFRIELDFAYIDARIPTPELKYVVEIMKPYLKDFFIGSLSCNPLNRELGRTSALNGLKFFFRRFPTFGTLRYHNISNLDLSTSVDNDYEHGTEADYEEEVDFEEEDESEIDDIEISDSEL